VPVFLEKIKKQISVTIIPGNHDANIEKLIPEGISLATSKGIIIEDALLTHGHTMPTENFSSVNKIIMGHVHPVFFQEKSIINGKRVWVTMKCNKQKIFPSKSGKLEIIIIPTFNKHFYTTNKKFYKKSISPILDKSEVLEAKILTLDVTIIGNESLLPNII
jgi:metallophosphoesterase superfamily enzyme